MKYTLIRSSRRRKSISLQVKHPGEVIVRAPKYVPKIIIDKFVNSKKTWITRQENKVKSLPPAKKLTKSEIDILTKKLHKYLSINLPREASRIGVKYKDFKVKHVKSYWGNCAANKTLSFNCMLAQKPKQAIDYVIIHELCHLKFHGHGKKFWNMVKEHDPHYKEHKRLLKNPTPLAL